MKDVTKRGVLVENMKDKERNTTQLHSQGFNFYNLKVTTRVLVTLSLNP